MNTINQPNLLAKHNCVLCEQVGGRLVFQNQHFRVIAVDTNSPDANFPAFYRLIWNQHVVEMTDLPVQQQTLVWQTILTIESCMREVLKPHKINLASFGNVVAHLHWHFIARFEWDSHFPNSVWASPIRLVDELELQKVQALHPRLDERIVQSLSSITQI